MFIENYIHFYIGDKIQEIERKFFFAQFATEYLPLVEQTNLKT